MRQAGVPRFTQFLIEAFSGKSEAKNERIFANMKKLSLLIGLGPDEIKRIHDDLGSAIYRQVCNKALKEGPLGATERSTLDSIKVTLGMESALCEKLVQDCQLFRVSSMVDEVFEQSSLTAEDSRKIRDMSEMLEVDLLKDADVSPIRLQKMYIVELQDIIDSGELTPEVPAHSPSCSHVHFCDTQSHSILSNVR